MSPLFLPMLFECSKMTYFEGAKDLKHYKSSNSARILKRVIEVYYMCAKD